ncbi:hypothetical protein KKE92_00370 [Candidatus Micrarchaeota archaeon]|nr:hypothetical protein [Candidatus Micrarchaeota archaeon]
MAKKKRLSRAERAEKLKAAQENAAGLFSGKGAVEPPQKNDPKPVVEPKPKSAPAHEESNDQREDEAEKPADSSPASSPVAKEETIDLSDSQIVSDSVVVDGQAPVASSPSGSGSLLDDILGSSPPPSSSPVPEPPDSSATRQETPEALAPEPAPSSSATRQETPAALVQALTPEEQFFPEPLEPSSSPAPQAAEPSVIISTAEPKTGSRQVYVKTEVGSEEIEAKDGKPATVTYGDLTALRSGVQVRFEGSLGGKKALTVLDSSKNTLAELNIAPSQTREVEVPSKDGPLKLTFEYKDGDGVYCTIDGGKTKTAHAIDKATAVGRFLGNVRYYLPELTMAGLFAAATSAVAWTSPYLANGLQGWHKVAIAAYAVVQLGLTTWSFFEKRNQRKELNVAEAAHQE